MSNSMYDSYSISEDDTTETFRITGQKRGSVRCEVRGVEEECGASPSQTQEGHTGRFSSVLYTCSRYVHPTTRSFPNVGSVGNVHERVSKSESDERYPYKMEGVARRVFASLPQGRDCFSGRKGGEKNSGKVQRTVLPRRKRCTNAQFSSQSQRRLPGVPLRPDKYNRPQKGPSRLPTNPQARYGQTAGTD